MLTSQALAAVRPLFPDHSLPQPQMGGVQLLTLTGPTAIRAPMRLSQVRAGQRLGIALPPPPPGDHFESIGHSLWTLLIGVLGGLVALLVGQRPSRQDSR